jgi:hypothetical protein
MFARLFLVDKHTIIGMCTVVKNNHTCKEILIIEISKIIKAKRIQEIAVDFKGISTFCTTILSSLQWVLQILHLSLRE